VELGKVQDEASPSRLLDLSKDLLVMGVPSRRLDINGGHAKD